MSKRKGNLSVLEAAQVVQAQGRAGDDFLVHVNADELGQMYDMWGEPSTNPRTGLPEYGFFSKVKKALKNIHKSAKKAHTPWTINKQDIEDIKHGKGIAATGTPLHGISAGIAAHKAMSPAYHMVDRIKNVNRHGLSLDTLKRGVKQTNHYIQDGVKENIIPLAVMAGGAAAGAAGSGGGGAAGAAGAGAAGGGAGAAAAIPAGIETVTVAGSALPAVSIADIAAGAAAAGAAANAAPSATQAPQTQGPPPGVENVTVTGSQLPPGVTLEDVGALAAAAASAQATNPNMGMDPSQGGAQAPENDMLGNIWDYIKNPDNWDQVIQGVGTVGALYQQYAGGSNEAPPPAAYNPGQQHDIRLRSRQFADPNLNYLTYGQGPEAAFYTYGEQEPVPMRRGGALRHLG